MPLLPLLQVPAGRPIRLETEAELADEVFSLPRALFQRGWKTTVAGKTT